MELMVITSRQFHHLSVLLLSLIALVTRPCVAWSVADETSLRGTLVTGYETSVRPSETTEVYLAFQLTSIDDVNIKDQTFSVSGWWVLEWEDSRLTWTSATYGIPVLQYYEDDLWTPAIVVTNCVNDLSAIDEDTIPLRVEYDGAVTWHPPGIFKTGCEMDTTYFPFDVQTCSIQVTSFGYTLYEVVVNSTKGIRMDYYSENGDWEVEEIWEKYDSYTDNGESYARMTYYVKVKRLNTYHWLNIILPVIVTSILVIFVFLLPVDSGEKMGYSLTCLLTYVVLLTLIAADMPTTAKHTSVLEVYLTVQLLLSGFTVYFSIVSIKYYSLPEDNKIPQILVTMTQKCWPLVDARKSVDKKSSQHKIHPEDGQVGKTEQQLKALGFSHGEKGAHTPVRPLSAISSDSDMYSQELIDGKVVSIVMDAMLLRIYGTAVPVMTFIFLIILVTGAT